MRNLPGELTILGRKYRICLVTNLGAGEQEYGHINTWLGEINIDAALDESMQWATLCHEVMHAIDHALALNLPEETVRRLDAGLWDFLRQVI